jgi:hypothetical protein
MKYNELKINEGVVTSPVYCLDSKDKVTRSNSGLAQAPSGENGFIHEPSVLLVFLIRGTEDIHAPAVAEPIALTYILNFSAVPSMANPVKNREQRSGRRQKIL